MGIYINNAEFANALREYRSECEQKTAEGLPHNPIPNYIAQCFLDIAKHYASKHNFAGYSFREDMVSEAAMACCIKVLKYDASISPYAFSYFSRICFRAFIDMILSEKSESYVKAKLFSMNPDDTFELDENDMSDHSGDNIGQDFIPYFDVEDYERKMEEKKRLIREKKALKEKTTSPLEDLME